MKKLSMAAATTRRRRMEPGRAAMTSGVSMLLVWFAVKMNGPSPWIFSRPRTSSVER